MPACPQCATEYAEQTRFCGRCGAVLAPEGATGDEPDPWLGRVVDGRYRVLAALGSGGMGIVYRVEHLQLGKIAAMKVLSPDTAGNKDMVRRFRLEAQAVSRLNHPNIVQTFDFGQWDGALYLVMEYVKGDDLAALLKRDGALPFARAAKLFVQVCSALTEAHDAGIIHRDLKPENLMVIRRRDGTEHAKVLDFGLAKLRERGESAAAITSGVQILGTPYYMAPEQVRGEALDPRADIYSLGATLYRVLTGTPPFQAPSPMSVLSKHLTDEVVPPRDRAPERALPPEADRIVLKAMAKSVEERYASATEVQRDLEAFLASAAAAGAALAASAAPAEEVAPAPAPARADMRTVAIEDGDVVESREDGERLRRQDLDAFERSLRWRRVLTRLLLPLGVAGVVAAGAFLFSRMGGEKAELVEHEPNNTAGYANLLPNGTAVRGAIGRVIEGGHPDVDYYRIPVGHGPRTVTARLEGVPGLDIVLELFDSQGRRLAKSDANGRGWGEWLQPTSIGPAESYLLVREVWVEGQKPSERPDDPYSLTVKWGPPQPGWESEPNDWEAAATPVAAGQAVRGYLGDPEDKDWFAITPAATGKLQVHARAPAGVDMVLLHDGETTRPEAKHVVNRRGPGGDEEVTLDAVAGRPVLVCVARKTAQKSKTERAPKGEPVDAKDPPPAGLDEPYELRADPSR